MDPSLTLRMFFFIAMAVHIASAVFYEIRLPKDSYVDEGVTFE